MNNRQVAVRDELFAVYMDSQRMVRNQRWKLIWYPKIAQYQLFDLEADPYELNNLASDQKHQQILKKMIQVMESQQKKYDDPLLIRR